MFTRTNLAWLQATREKPRLLTAVAGIAFAAILIFMQLGFLASLFDGATRPHRAFDAELFLTHPKQLTFLSPKGFSRHRLYQALACPGVSSVTGVNVGTCYFRNPLSMDIRSILVFGTDPGRQAFNLPAVRDGLGGLKKMGSILFDRASRPEYGPIAGLLAGGRAVEVELADRRVRVCGLFTLGASFAADGTVITSDTTFAHLFSRHPPGEIEVGLVKLLPGADRDFVATRLQRFFHGQVRVSTAEQFAEMERVYWAESSGIGFVFGLGVFVGFLVGVVVVYQILYADVSDHLREYATLKAIGYSNRRLLAVLVEESVILAALGYLPAFILSLFMYRVAHELTLLPMHMTWERAAVVLVLTVVMCAVSAAIASGKLRHADPAEVF